MNLRKLKQCALYFMICPFFLWGNSVLSASETVEGGQHLQNPSSADWVANDYISKIIEEWDSDFFLSKLDPTIRSITDSSKIQMLFQQYKLLGTIMKQNWPAASGRNTSAGTIWSCFAQVAFQNEITDIFIRLKETSEGEWFILTFTVSKHPENRDAFYASYCELPLKELENEYTMLTKEGFDDIGNRIRNKSALLLAYSDQLINAEKTLKAAEVLRTYLSVRPDDLGRQLQLAELLAAEHADEKQMRYEYVYKNTENIDWARAAASELSLDAVSFFSTNTLGACDDSTTDVVCFRMQGMDELIYRELAEYLKEQSELNIVFLPNPVELPRPDQNFHDWFVETAFLGLMRNIPQNRYPLICIQLGMNPETNFLELDIAGKKQLVRDVCTLMNQGNVLRDQFDAELAFMKEAGIYESTKMTQYLRKKFPYLHRRSLAYVGVTDQMISLADRKDCYGYTDGAYGIVSTYHFMSRRTGEHENRKRLISRLGKQTLSTVGATLGLHRRCISPECPRAFPKSVQARDNMSDCYCMSCQSAINEKMSSRSLMSSEAFLEARYFKKKGDFDSAELWLSICLDSGPCPRNLFGALLLKAEIHEEQKQYSEALDAHIKALGNCPSDIKAGFNVRSMLMRLSETEELSASKQLEFYNRLLEVDPNSVEWNADKALFLYHIGQKEDASGLISWLTFQNKSM